MDTPPDVSEPGGLKEGAAGDRGRFEGGVAKRREQASGT